MKKLWIGIASACSAWMVAGYVAWAQDAVPPVSASGEAAVASGNAAQARQSAIASALKSAAVMSAGRLLSPEFLLKNEDVILARLGKDTAPFIQDYRLVKEWTETGVLKVQLTVVPRIDRIQEELARWGIIFDRAYRPRIGIVSLEERVIAERGSRKKESSRWASLLIRRLQGLGYTVEMTPAKAVRPEVTPDITLWGNLNLQAGKLDAQIQAAIRKPYLDLAAVRESLPLDQGEELAAGMLATRILDKILPVWFRRAGEGRSYSLTIEGWSSYRPYKDLWEFLSASREGISMARESELSSGRVSFEIVFDGSALQLAQLLAHKRVGGGTLQITRVTDRSILMKAP